jgi:ATP-binding cassette subfamily B multidrug efflux pump
MGGCHRIIQIALPHNRSLSGAFDMFRFFENLVDPYVDYPEEDRPPTRLWPFMRAYSQPFLQVFFWTALISVIVAAVEVGLIYYMGRVVDLMGGDPALVWQTHGTELILVALFIILVRPMIHVLDVLLLNNAIMPNFGTLIRWRAHKHVLRQSVGWFENDFAGRIANRIMQTPPAAGEVIFQVFDAISFSLAYLIGAAVLLMLADVRLLLPLLVWFGFYALLIRWTVARVGPASKAASDARSAVTGRVVDAYTNIHSVKMFAHHDSELTYAKDAIERTRKTFQIEMRIYSKMDMVLVTLNGFLIVGVVGWAMFLWTQGEASVGVVAAATALTLRLNAMTGWIMWALTSFFRQLGVVAEGMETIAQPIDLVDVPGAKALVLDKGRIELRGLSHHYGRATGGLDHLDLTIEPGQKIGLIGRSGAGKSTLVKLLLRFYDAESGQILIDGQDIAQVTQDSLRSQIGMVQQDSSLLHRSVRDNILYGRPDASEGQMRAAAKQAEADEFIHDLADPQGRLGYDAQVGERGVKLSGGQRQRVTLARVILKDAPILLLDEATSALDSEVEAAIQDTLYGMMKGKTVIAIAHRLSTIAQMDRILVMDQGRIVEDGTHESLLAKPGLYASFWARQSGGFLTPEAKT